LGAALFVMIVERPSGIESGVHAIFVGRRRERAVDNMIARMVVPQEIT
jgi:hypothetical protein